MKNCIKILVFVAAALFLFSAGSLLVNAEDGNGTEQENKQYKTTVTLRYIDFSDRYDGGYTTYTIISSKPLYIYYLYTEEPAACMPQLYSGEIDDSTSSGISSSGSFSVSGIMYFPDGSTRMVNNFDLGALTYDGRIVKTIEASCPIFYSFDAMKNYILDGDESGWTNKPTEDENNATYDESLGYLQGLSINTVLPTDCHGSIDSFTNCFELSWVVPEYDRSKYMEFCEFKFDFQYSYSTMTATKRLYGNSFLDFTSAGIKLFISATEGTHVFCSHEFYELLNLDVSATSFNIQDVKKIYVRLARVERASGNISYGDWAVYNVDFRSGILTNDRVMGDANIYPGDSEIGSDGSINGEPIQTVPSPDSGDNGFSFAGIDLTDVVNIGKYFIGLVESLINMIGNFPALFNRVFLFLPAEIRTMIYMFFVILVVSGLLKIFV